MQPLSMQLTATDTDVPAQTLTYSITSGPEGLVVDPSTGMITWTPTEVQGLQGVVVGLERLL